LVVFDNTPSSFNKGITVQAMGGVVLSVSVTTKEHPTLVYTGTGTLTVVADKALSTTNQFLSITADDFSLAGGVWISSGTAEIVVKTTTTSHTISLGTSGTDMAISDAELGTFATSNQMTIGDSSSGDISVGGIQDSNSDDFALLVLRATKGTRTVTFETSVSTFNKGITIRATTGVIVNADTTITSSGTIFNIGTGTVTIASSKTLSTAGQLLSITTDDFDLAGDMSTGSSFIVTKCYSPGRTVGFGSGTGSLGLTGTELQMIKSSGMVIGGANCADQVVDGVTQAHSTAIAGVLTPSIIRDDADAVFSGTSSTFHAISVQADNGVTLSSDLSTTSGNLYLDGDVENSSSADSQSYIKFTAGRTISSSHILTLEATAGDVIRLGMLTLEAGTGINLFENLLSEAADAALVINGDTGSTGRG
jgi:hypothetical protein